MALAAWFALCLAGGVADLHDATLHSGAPVQGLGALLLSVPAALVLAGAAGAAVWLSRRRTVAREGAA
ncbi:MAG: hypothetical protein JWM27_1535, partial [Gemmatimonadetes bacterium]|nr:hypothetical protein [Gemmatimonadota bacterium]